MSRFDRLAGCSRRQLLAGAGLAAAGWTCDRRLALAAEGDELDLMSLSSRQHACLDKPVVAHDASLADRLLSPVEQAIMDQEGAAIASSLATAAAPMETLANVDPSVVPANAPAKAAYKSRWNIPHGGKLKVAFANGIRALQDGVLDLIKPWEACVDFTFARVARGSEDILIRFHRGFGHYSHIGRESKNVVATGEPSMNFAFLDQTTVDLDDKYNEFVVLHEFGHALGCIHEHQHPGASVRFRETDPKVIAYFQRGLNTRDINTIRFNVFRRFNEKELIRDGVSKYDAKSIMHYAFPGWMFQDGRDRAQNFVLSELDQWFAALMYPRQNGPKIDRPNKPLPKPPPAQDPGVPQELQLNGGSIAAALDQGSAAIFRFTITAEQAAKPVALATEGWTPVVLQLVAASDRSRDLTPAGFSNSSSAYGTYDFTNGAIHTTLAAGTYELTVKHVSSHGSGRTSVSLKSGESPRRLFAPNAAR